MEYREEELNSQVARVLAKRGLAALPETIRKTSTGTKLPDVTIGLFSGISVNIEGKKDKGRSSRKDVEAQCKGRIDDGLANMSIAVCYPPELANVKFQDLDKELEASEFAIKIFSVSGKNSPGTMDWYNDTSDEGFQNCSVNDLARVIKDAYNELISDKTIQNNVKLIDSTIESCVEKLSNQTGAVARLEQIVTIAFDGEEDSEEEDGKEKI